MTTERSTAIADPTGTELPASDGRSLVDELDAGGWDHAWHLGGGLPSPPSRPGAHHAQATLETMLFDPVRNSIALSDPERPTRALVIGCGDGRLAHALLGWGIGAVTAVDSREDSIVRAGLLREHFALDPAELRLIRSELTADSLPEGPFDVVVVDAPAREQAETALLIAAAEARTALLCAIVSADRVADTIAAREAGFASVRLAPVPHDAERSFIAHETSLLLASGTAAPEAGDG
jgi:SAM-dependent methyltransferase